MAEINLDLIMGKGKPGKGETPEGEGKELVDLVNKIKDIAMEDSKKPEDTLSKITDMITTALGAALTGGKPEGEEKPEDKEDKAPKKDDDNPFERASENAKEDDGEKAKGDNPFEAMLGKGKPEDKPEGKVPMFPPKKKDEEDEEE